MKICSFFLFPLIFLFCLPIQSFCMIDSGPIKVKKSKSTGINPVCAYPTDNIFEFELLNDSDQEVEITNLIAGFNQDIDNSVTQIQFFDKNGNIVGLPFVMMPKTDAGGIDFLTAKLFTSATFNDSHHSIGLHTIDVLSIIDFTVEGEEFVHEIWTQGPLCGNITVNQANMKVDPCALMDVDLLKFEIANQTSHELNFVEISASILNENNEVTEVILLDGCGEETVSTPYELDSFNEANEYDGMDVLVNLELPLGHELEENVTAIILSYVYFANEIWFEETTVFNYDFEKCEVEKGFMSVSPNPINTSSIAHFKIEKEEATVSAWLFPKQAGGSSMISLINEQTYLHGNHQFEIPARFLSGGYYELVLKINDRVFSHSVIVAKE